MHQRFVYLTLHFVILLGSRASDYGLMQIDETGRIINFAEKPKGSALKTMVFKFIQPKKMFLKLLCNSNGLWC